MHLFIVANRFEDCTGSGRLHLDLMGLSKDDLAIEVNLRNHTLWIDCEHLFVGSKVIVVLEEVLGVQVLVRARHYQDLALLTLLICFFGLVCVYLCPNKLFNYYLIA